MKETKLTVEIWQFETAWNQGSNSMLGVVDAMVSIRKMPIIDYPGGLCCSGVEGTATVGVARLKDPAGFHKSDRQHP